MKNWHKKAILEQNEAKIGIDKSKMCKVRIFWEGHKIWKNIPLKIWRYLVKSNFVAFSEYPNFNFICELYLFDEYLPVIFGSQIQFTNNLQKTGRFLTFICELYLFAECLVVFWTVFVNRIYSMNICRFSFFWRIRFTNTVQK